MRMRRARGEVCDLAVGRLAAALGVSVMVAIAIYYLFERPVTKALRSALGQIAMLRGIRLEPKIGTKTEPIPPAPTAG